MKQKQVKTPAKAVKQTKSVKNAAAPKKFKKNIDESENEEEEEEIVPEKVVAKPQIVKKKGHKGKKVVEEPVDFEEQEDEDESEVQQKVLAKRQTMKKKVPKGKKVVEEPVDVEEQEDEDEDDEAENIAEEETGDDENDEESGVEEEGDEDENEEEGNEIEEEGNEIEEEDGESSDELAPPSKVLTGPLRPVYKDEQCVHVKNLPKKCKQINIVEAFAKYGAIQQIHIVTTPVCTSANIAFKNAKSAAAAVADNGNIKVGDNVVSVANIRDSRDVKKEQNRECSVFVSNIPIGTTVEQIREFFETCGEVQNVKMPPRKHGMSQIAFVTFEERTSVTEALKLHNAVFNDSNIKVFENTENRGKKPHCENLTITLENKQEFKSIDVSKLKSIFAKCGEIECVDVVCKKLLAFIVFKTEKAVQKALQLNGETREGIILGIEPYSTLKKWTAIHVVNVPKFCTEDDFRTLFAGAGAIKSITLRPGYANIYFEDSDGYCKSFLYNESLLKGKMIFIEPLSARKAQILKQNYGKMKGTKRPFQNGHSAFISKKPKIN